jgi:hypothetical protein
MKTKNKTTRLKITIRTHSTPSEENATYAVFEKASLVNNKKAIGPGKVTGFCMGRMNPEKTEAPEFQIVAAGDSTMTFVIDLDAILK